MYVSALFKYLFFILLSHAWSPAFKRRWLNSVISLLNMWFSCCNVLSWMITFCYNTKSWKTLQSCSKKLSRMKLIMFLKIVIQKWIHTAAFSFNLLNSYHICLLSSSIAALSISSFVISWLLNCRYRNRSLFIKLFRVW